MQAKWEATGVITRGKDKKPSGHSHLERKKAFFFLQKREKKGNYSGRKQKGKTKLIVSFIFPSVSSSCHKEPRVPEHH